MNYQQLTEGKRYQISAHLERKISVSEIADIIKCHRATIYRELTRNTKWYCPDKAHKVCLIRRIRSAKYRITSKVIEYIRILIELDWSPEQVSRVLTKCDVPESHEWIYQYIHKDKQNKGRLYHAIFH